MADDADTTGQLTAEEKDTTDDEQQTNAEHESSVPPTSSGMRWPVTAAVVIVTAVSGLFGWLGYRAYEVSQTQQQSDLFLDVGRQAALNLATISSNQADADVQRILDMSVGEFHEDFAERAPAFIEMVKKAQSNATGSVAAAGLESEAPDEAQVIVAVDTARVQPS